MRDISVADSSLGQIRQQRQAEGWKSLFVCYLIKLISRIPKCSNFIGHSTGSFQGIDQDKSEFEFSIEQFKA